MCPKPATSRRVGTRTDRRQLNASLSPEHFDRVARAARKVNMSRSMYASLFFAENIDLIDPEGAISGDQA